MGFVKQDPFLYRNVIIGYNVSDTISSREGNNLMSLDYTDRLNRIAKKAGMLDFTKVRSWRKTAGLIKKSMVSIDDYFTEKGLPIRLICGDTEPIDKIIELCPNLANVDVCPTEELQNKNLSDLKDCTILVVRNEILDTLRLETDIYNKLPNCRVCGIYEYFEFNHINVRYVFWQYYKFQLHSKNIADMIRPFFNHMVSYEKLNILLNKPIHRLRPNSNIAVYLPSYLYNETIFCANQIIKKDYLTDDELRMQYKKLMGFCVIEKDIIGLKKYIELYADRYDSAYKKYIVQIDEIITDMKKRIARRNSKDIIINWIDAVSNNRLKEEMPFLYNLSMGGGTLKAEYAYTCMPYTTSTMKTIMTGMDPIEGRLYDYKLLNDDMKLLKLINKNDYKFLYFGNAFFQRKIIPRKYYGKPISAVRTTISTEFMWNAMNHLAMAKDTPYFLIIHQDFETHAPYFCPESGELKSTDRKEKERLKSSAWIDKQWEFYLDIMGEKSLQIFLGDHGDGAKYIYAYQNERLNIAFFIRNASKRIDFSKGMFSIKRLSKLISYLMDWEAVEEKEIFSDYVVSECYDYYNVQGVNNIINNENKLSDKNRWMQVRTIRNRLYAYILFFDGKEIFYDLTDETENLINRPEYAEIIWTMREKLGTEFIDIYKEDFFIHSRKLYEAYKNKGLSVEDSI